MKNTICFFNMAKTWGGGEKWHLDIALLLKNQGYSVLVCAHQKGELLVRAQKQGIETYGFSVGNLSFLNPIKSEKLRRFFAGKQIQTIVLNMSQDIKFAAVVAKKAGIKRIIYRRGSAIPIKNKRLNRYLFQNVITEVLANSEKTKETINENNPSMFPKDKIRVIYNGMDLDKFDASFTEKNTKHNKIILGNIGRLVHQKGQIYLVDIAKKLIEKGVDFEIRIGGTGVLEEKLKKAVTDNKLTNYITFTGFVDNAKAFISDIDIFVLPSLWEGFGYVLTEAMACAKPVVAFNISSNPEIVAEGKTGFLADFPNTEQFAEKIAVLAKNEALRITFGKAGRQRVEEQFRLKDRFEELKEYLTNSSK